MSHAATLDRIVAVVARTFDTDAGTLSAASSAADVDGWDSVSHAMLVLELEDEFGVLLDFGTALEAEDLGQLAGYIDSLQG